MGRHPSVWHIRTGIRRGIARRIDWDTSRTPKSRKIAKNKNKNPGILRCGLRCSAIYTGFYNGGGGGGDGDYDVDGASATALLANFFNSINIPYEIYIPDRKKEGYGLSIDGINTAIDWNADIIITCDCGINAIDQAEYAKKNNILYDVVEPKKNDFIIKSYTDNFLKD